MTADPSISPRLSASLSLWDRSSDESDQSQPLSGDRQADVAIVGGGFTGLSTALHGAQKGLACHVLEAETIGHGGSGRNVGLVNAGLWLPPQEVRALLGNEIGGRLVAELGRTPDYVFSLIEQHQIRCEATRTGTLHAAHAPSGLRDLERRAAAWQALGAPVRLLNAAEVAEKTGSAKFHGGLLDARAGTINPMGYVRGLARAARAAGAEISTGTKVRALVRDGTLWRVETNRGMVTAPHVVIATNAYTADLWPGLAQSFTPIRFFQIATQPLGDDAAHILPEGQGLWDTGKIMLSLRRDQTGRLIIGSMGSVFGGTEGLTRRWADRKLHRLFPELGPLRFEDAWHGDIAFTPDHLFRIHRLAAGLYAPIGYNGRGITTGTLFGRALADLFAGASEDSLPVPVSDLVPDRGRGLKMQAYRTAFFAKQAAESLI
ncbi:NAD(P)/FAD-dependent oxidoreductase [Tritonibacter horizontis]|uniref:Gamma-glutamylputrescine oxidoreductase n=1 Tax=Tritonibacter horizontis TaxID=1768241 RepID=A0A132BX04_9RHOB|nr:FAD-binding oxidoreductase [Tritonibacter horizontis]KUP92901.1 gamma-glutamylputrescine oxidoreductase [Tritonibacter horizontis]